METLVLLLFVFVLAGFLGFELIQKVPSQLHTPLMSGSNAISGITVVGALIACGIGDNSFGQWLGFGAIILATINVVGGYLVTDRMLGMFKKKDKWPTTPRATDSPPRIPDHRSPLTDHPCLPWKN